MEYAKFGDGYVQRQNDDEEWHAVPSDDERLAAEAIEAEKRRIAEVMANRPPSIVIRRASGEVEEIP